MYRKESRQARVIMMEISINKMKIVIDELRAAEMEYKRQLDAFEKIYRGYQSIEREGKDKHMLKKIFEDLNNEYLSIKTLGKVLTEIVKHYDNAEKNIINWSVDTFENSPVIKRMDIGAAQKILNKYNIKIT